MRVIIDSLPCAMIARLARFIESWQGVVLMWLALALYCYL